MEEDNVAHYLLKFANEFTMQIRYADALGIASSYVVIYYADVIDMQIYMLCGQV